MSLETIIFDALKGLVGNRVFPDVAPEKTVRPYITYQAVGGDAINYLGRDVPNKSNARMQVNVWADTRLQASSLAKQVEDILRQHTALQVTVLGAPFAVYEDDTKLRGTIQDFSIWYDA